MTKEDIIDIIKSKSNHIQSDLYLHQGSFENVALEIKALIESEKPTKEEIQKHIKESITETAKDYLLMTEEEAFESGIHWALTFKR